MRIDFLEHLDEEMRPYAPKLRDDVQVPEQAALKLATTLCQDIDARGQSLLKAISESSPLSIQRRLDAWHRYRLWRTEIEPRIQCPDSDIPLPAHQRQRLMESSFHTLSLLIPHLYMSFVFPAEHLFDTLRKHSASGSTLQRCSTYIRDGEPRSLRNAIAHGHWHYDDSGRVLAYFARVGDDASQPMQEFKIALPDLQFLLKLTQCVAWTSLLASNDPEADGTA